MADPDDPDDPDDPEEQALLAEADVLYGLPLGEFTPARDARAKELKGEAPALSAAVKALRKPATAAWVVDLLVRRETEQVEQVLTTGVALREAQAAMSADELRALTRQRRQLTAAVTTRARALARSAGLKVTQAVADQVEATLTAAMVDEDCGRAVRSGLLIAPLAATGVGEVDVAAAVAAPQALGFEATPTAGETATGGDADGNGSGRPDLRVVPDPDADAKALAAARAVLEDAEAEVAEATDAHGEAESEVATLSARSLQLQSEIDELTRRVADLEDTLEGVDDELGDAESVRDEAAGVLTNARRERDAAVAVVARHANRED